MSSLPSDGAPLAQEAGGTVTDSVELTVPNLGPSVESARLVAWSKEVGQSVAADEPICRLAVNQLEFEVCSTADGELTQLLAFPGDAVRSGDSLAEVASPAAVNEPAPVAPAADPLEAAEPELRLDPPAVQVTEPFYATEPSGAIADTPPDPDPVFEPPPEPDPVVELSPEPDPIVELTPEPDPIVELTPEAESEPVVELRPDPAPPSAQASSPEDNGRPGAPLPSSDDDVDWSRWRSPIVRKLAEDHDIDLSEVEGTGTGGRVRKRDVLAHIEDAPTS